MKRNRFGIGQASGSSGQRRRRKLSTPLSPGEIVLRTQKCKKCQTARFLHDIGPLKRDHEFVE